MAKHVEKMTLNDASSDDLNIFYYGGCGGFYLLHQLLLTDNFYCYLEGKPYLEINKKQFDILDIKSWKNNEVWPENTLTKKEKNTLRKIYFHCNDIKDWINAEEFKICLYTDYRSHIRLAANKQAFFYNTEGSYYDGNYIGYTKKLLKDYNSEIFKGYKVAMKKADLNVKTQEVWTLKGLEKFLNTVGCEMQQHNIDFLKKFLNFHPTKLLQKIGVSSEVV